MKSMTPHGITGLERVKMFVELYLLNNVVCGWMLYTQSSVSGIVFPVGPILVGGASCVKV
jgi:hypothetical protein